MNGWLFGCKMVWLLVGKWLVGCQPFVRLISYLLVLFCSFALFPCTKSLVKSGSTQAKAWFNQAWFPVRQNRVTRFQPNVQNAWLTEVFLVNL